MSMELLKKHIGADPEGWYQENKKYNEANDLSLNTLEFFALKAAEPEYSIAPEPAELERREKRMLERFSVLPGEPHRARKVRQFAADSYAIEKYWEDHGCPWFGPKAPTLEKAFTVNESLRATFPIFVDTFIQAGRLASPILDRLVQDTINVNSKTAQHSEFFDTATSPAPGVETAEGARTEQVKITWREREITLRKLGYEVLATYEALAWSRLPILARGLERVGRRFQYLVTEMGLEVLIAGDGSTPTNAAGTVAGGGAATDYDDYLDLYFAFEDEYVPDMFITSQTVIRKALTLAEFKDPLAGGAFQSQGRIPTPLGIPFERWKSKGIAGSYNNDVIVAVDSSALGLVEYTAGGILNESERLIRQGWTLNVSTVWLGFGMMDPEARKVGLDFA
jgi:Phage capsid family